MVVFLTTIKCSSKAACSSNLYETSKKLFSSVRVQISFEKKATQSSSIGQRLFILDCFSKRACFGIVKGVVSLYFPLNVS